MKFSNNKLHTEPLVLHFNGGHQLRLTNELVDTIIESSMIKKPDDLTILTFATENIVNRSPLIKQLKRYSIDFHNICEYYSFEKWDNTYKIKLMNEFLNSNIIKTKYLIVLDSIDILLSENFDEILDKFKQTGKKIFYGSTPSRYPDVELETQDLIENKGDFKYLNAGTIIAEVEYYKDFIKTCYDNLDTKNNKWLSEQYEIRKNYCAYDKSIIDYNYECTMFQTLYYWDYFNIYIQNNYVMLD